MARSLRERLSDARDAYQAETAKHARPKPSTPAPSPAGQRSWSTPPTASFKGGDGQFHLYPDGVDHKQGLKVTTIPLESIRSVAIEDGADLEARITATRLVLIGVFALAFRKRKGGEKYLAIESDDAFTVVEVDRKSIGKAQQFAAAVRTATKR